MKRLASTCFRTTVGPALTVLATFVPLALPQAGDFTTIDVPGSEHTFARGNSPQSGEEGASDFTESSRWARVGSRIRLNHRAA